jgi:outer membrane biosynthesis protein TonB
MTDLSSDSSASENEVEDGLNLNVVNDMIREYEKGLKKEARKKHYNAFDNIKEVKGLEVEDLANADIQLTRGQMRQLIKQQNDELRAQRTAQKIEAERRKELLRQGTYFIKNPEYKEKEKPIPVKKKSTRTVKEKVVEPPKPVPVAPPVEEPKVKSFQARKPKLEEEIEQKTAALQRLDQTLNGNPYYAALLNSRIRR